MKKYLLSLLLLVGCSGSINANVTVTINVPKYYGTISIPIGLHETVKDLKKNISEKYKIPVEQLRVTRVYPPGVLKDNHDLFEIRAVKIDIIEQPVGTSIPELEEPGAPETEVEEEEPYVPIEEPKSYLPTLTTGHKVGAGIIIAALTAALAGVMKVRSYRAIKNRLINTYQLGKLTPLQNKVWMATALASYRIPWYLRYLVNNTMGTLSDFVGSNPRAVAELYYGHEASQDELDAFIDNFFSTVQE